ncbi:MAG: queuosine precursor transporter [Candidatus Levybacteria bacterium]|nr:queuosine precursor transporter [Candidatus Levybacteria bacterium]
MFKIEKLDLLISLYITCIALSELMGAKTFPLLNLFGYQLNASVGIFVLPLVFTINDIIVEVYGVERARGIIRLGLLSIFLIFIFSFIATLLPPSTRFENKEIAYDSIFGLSMRIAASSLVAFTLAEFLDVFVFAKLRRRFKNSGLWLRNNLSNFASQFLDTSIFITFAFYAFDKPIGSNVAFLLSLIFPYWLLKCGMSVIETPLVYLGVRWLKEKSR